MLVLVRLCFYWGAAPCKQPACAKRNLQKKMQKKMQVMGWLNGGGDWEQGERSGMLLAVLDLAAKCD